jgi:cephalosporin hydroxylase
MKLLIDTDAGTVSMEGDPERQALPFGSPEGFALLSRAWLRAGWDAKYVYSFTWLGRPIIQLPEDMVRLQEVIYRTKPDVIVETGVAHGGSLIFYASLMNTIGRGRVIGVDVEIRPHNRRAIEEHQLASMITLIEGDSVAPQTVSKVRGLIAPEEKVLVLLDSNHTYQHVLDELRAYAPMVSLDSYAVAMDGIMEEVAGGPRTRPDWVTNNPRRAAEDFARSDPRFIVEEPRMAFNEGTVDRWVTYWPGGFLKRVR